MATARVRKDDFVQVISGKDKGKTGKVMRVFPKQGKCIVEKVATARRHQKAKPQGGPAGIVEKHLRIDLSKVMPFDAKAKKPSRIKIVTEGEDKVRKFVKSGEKL